MQQDLMRGHEVLQEMEGIERQLRMLVVEFMATRGTLDVTGHIATIRDDLERVEEMAVNYAAQAIDAQCRDAVIAARAVVQPGEDLEDLVEGRLAAQDRQDAHVLAEIEEFAAPQASVHRLRRVEPASA